MDDKPEILNIKGKFHQFGYKYTEQRQIILDVLLEHPGLHLSSDDICEFLKQKKTNIGQSTVYRTLIMLEKMNIIHGTSFEDGFTRYELVKDNEGHSHHHLICSKCGSITDINNDLLEDLEQHIADNYGFMIKDHRLEFYGLCKNCRGKE